MTNGIRQGSGISPYLFNFYVDLLNIQLSEAKLGCYVGEETLHNFSYADDLALLAPSASALNSLVMICQKFADGNFIQITAHKSVVLLLPPPGYKLINRPNIYLGDNNLSYVEELRYLGHVIPESFTDDKDIERERRALATRGNLIIHRFKYCSEDVKCCLLGTYCLQIYYCLLWSRYKKYTLSRLRVTYNNITRRLMGLPSCCIASSMFLNLNVNGLQEVLRLVTYRLVTRI